VTTDAQSIGARHLDGKSGGCGRDVKARNSLVLCHAYWFRVQEIMLLWVGSDDAEAIRGGDWISISVLLL
jgi:hypothetical protein